MAISAEQLAYSGLSSINYYLKKEPVDQIDQAKPFLKALMERKEDYAGGEQYIVVTLHFDDDSNFQSYSGASVVTYNERRMLKEAKYRYASFHDGFGLDEDTLTRNGIKLTDMGRPVVSEREKIQIVNLLKTNTKGLRRGFQTGLDLVMHRDGTQSVEDVPGLDHLVSLTPNTGTVAGIDAAANSFWRNHAALNLTQANLEDAMETAWSDCILYGGFAPDLILMGKGFQKAYRKATNQVVSRTVQVAPTGGAVPKIDMAVGNKTDTGLYYNNVPMQWDPTFEVLDTKDSPTVKWTNRCYFLNLQFLKLMPITGHWLLPRNPKRPHDKYVHYWALTAKCSLVDEKRNSHAVLSVTGA